jgi:hypothetical protein
LLIAGNPVLFITHDSEHAGPARGAFAFHGFPLILHGYHFAALNGFLCLAFHAIAFIIRHIMLLSSRWLSGQKNYLSSTGYRM